MKTLPLLAAILSLAAASVSAQDWAEARIKASPRHPEWVKVKHDNREVDAFVTYPEVKDKATAVVVIHEIFGLSDWARLVTDELAEAGYIAIAPDFLSGLGPNQGGTKDLGDGVGRAISSLPVAQKTADLNAVVDYVAKLPACNGKVVVMGFCWGGTETFRYATVNPHIKAALPFYGTGPTDDAALARIACPVHGFYAEKDGRIGQTLAKTTAQMKAAGKTYEPVTYEGAGHGFMRDGDDPGSTNANHDANVKARAAAWVRVKEILGKL